MRSQVSIRRKLTSLDNSPLPLVINCPSTNRMTIYITDWLKITTIDQIENDGETIRVLDVKNIEVTHVRRSLEYYDPMYRDSMIVVSKNNTSGAASG